MKTRNAEPMTIEAIERDPWNAVVLDLKDATPELTGFVAVIAGRMASHCEEMAAAASGRAERDDWLALADTARERAAEAMRIVENREPDAPQPMTLEAIEREPRNALKIQLPDDASAELLSRVVDTVCHLREAFHERAQTVPTEELRDAYRRLDGLAEAREQEAIRRLDKLEPMTIEGIARDPRSAINNAIPEAPSDELLTAAREAVALCAQESFRALQAAPLREMPGMDQDYNAARARADELDEIIQARASEATPADAAAPPTDNAAIDRVRAELREAWQQPAFNPWAIDVDKWTSVYLPIPGDAPSGLLLLARDAAADCFREAGESEPRVPNDAPEWTRAAPNAARFWNALPGDDASAAKARLAELDRLIEPNPQAAINFLETKFETAAPLLKMTIAAIGANKWAAVDMPIPENADALLLDQASFAAFDCFNERVPPPGASPEAWAERRAAAGERVKELGDRMDAVWDTLDRPERKDLRAAIDHAEAVRAWEASAFSFDTISVDPWTAVYLQIPENAERDLLERARGWAADLAEYAARDPLITPLITMPVDAPEPLAAATARVAELERRMTNQLSPEPVRAETRDEMEPRCQGRPDPYSDQAAGRAYDQYVAQAGEQPTAESRNAFIQDWREAREEDREAAIDAAYERGDLGNRSAQPEDADAEALTSNPRYSRPAPAQSLTDLDADIEATLARPTQATPLIHQVWEESVTTGEPVIVQAIKRDPWNAVALDIPPAASAEVLNTIAGTAQALRIHAEERAVAAVSLEETEHWNDLALKADQRFANAIVKFYEAAEREGIELMKSAPNEIAREARSTPEPQTASPISGPQENDAYLSTMLGASAAHEDAPAQEPRQDQRRGRHL